MELFNLVLDAIIKLFIAFCVGVNMLVIVWAIANYIHHQSHLEVDENGNLVSY